MPGVGDLGPDGSVLLPGGQWFLFDPGDAQAYIAPWRCSGTCNGRWTRDEATVAGIPIEIVLGQECEKAEETSVTNRPAVGEPVAGVLVILRNPLNTN